MITGNQKLIILMQSNIQTFAEKNLKAGEFYHFLSVFYSYLSADISPHIFKKIKTKAVLRYADEIYNIHAGILCRYLNDADNHLLAISYTISLLVSALKV